MFDLVIFDCDGVLIDSEIISARMLVDELAGLGVCIDLDYVARHFLGRSYPTVMKQIRAEFGLDLPPEFEDAYRARLMAAFARDLRIMPHVRDVLAAIDQPYCVATSSSPMRANSSLDLMGLSHLAGSRRFTGGSHLPKPLGSEPEDARPHRHFDSFATFFTLDPRLRSRP